MKTLYSALTLFGVVAAAPALAAGYNVDLQSARATGMATAVTADVHDASAVFYNPADLVQGTKGVDLQLGDTAILLGNTFKPASGAPSVSGDTGVVPPFNAYASYQITDKLAVGVGVFEQFGAKATWPSGWIGQELTDSAQLTAFNFNPEVAYQFGPVKVGAGLQLVRATVDLSRTLQFVDSQGTAELAGGAWGVGGNAGVQVDLLQGKLAVGATYRSRVQLDFSGNAHFSNVPAEFAGTGSGELHDQTVTTSVTLPDVATIGVSVRPTARLRVNADVDYYAWQVYHALTIHFEDSSLDTTQPKRWSHSFNYHLGGEYDLTSKVSLRAGVLYDRNPSPDDTRTPDLPDADRVNLALGAGYHQGRYAVDVGYQYIVLLDSTSTNTALAGTYGGHVHCLGVSLGYRF